MKVFTKIATSLINPNFKFTHGGEPIRIVTKALKALEKKQGGLSRERIVDYCVCSAYPFKNRGTKWKVNQVFGSKSIERFDADKGRRFFEDKWLATGNITRADLLTLIIDRSSHPQAQYVYLPMEEATKLRMLNSEAGYLVCQSSTLGWSPESAACSQCRYIERCQVETGRKYPEIYRLRMEIADGSKEK